MFKNSKTLILVKKHAYKTNTAIEYVPKETLKSNYVKCLVVYREGNPRPPDAACAPSNDIRA